MNVHAECFLLSLILDAPGNQTGQFLRYMFVDSPYLEIPFDNSGATHITKRCHDFTLNARCYQKGASKDDAIVSQLRHYCEVAGINNIAEYCLDFDFSG